MADCLKPADMQKEIQAQLEALAKGLGVTVQELLKSYVTADTFNGEIEAIKLDIKKITEIGELDTESIAEKIQKINETIGKAEDDVVKSIFDQLAANSDAIKANEKAVNDLNAKVDSSVEALNNKIATNESSIAGNKAKIDELEKKAAEYKETCETGIANVQKEIDTLNGDVNTDGSVAKQVNDAIADEVKRTNLLIDEVNEGIDAVNANVGEVKAKVETVEGNVADINKVLNDSKDEDGNLVKGLKTQVTDNTASIQKEVEDRKAAIADLEEKIGNAASDICFETGVIDGTAAANAFRNVFGLAPLSNDNSNDSSGDDL